MGDRVCQAGLRKTRAWRRLFPLPEGEGQGEGERRFDSYRISHIRRTHYHLMTPFCQANTRSRALNSKVMMVEKKAAMITRAA